MDAAGPGRPCRHVAPSTSAQLEAGAKQASLEMLERLAKALRVKPGVLVDSRKRKE